MHGHVPPLEDFLDTVGTLSPHIKQFQIRIPHPHLFDSAICSHIRRQTSLQVLHCHDVTLDADIISHLSGLLTLTELSFTLFPYVPNWIGFVFAFPTLTRLEIRSQSLEPINELLSCIQLPKVEDISVNSSGYLSKETFRAYTTTVRNVCSPNSLASISIRNVNPPALTLVDNESGHRLTLDDLRACMTLVNLRHVNINIRWSVDLTDDDLLALVSTWSHIHTLHINEDWGWRTSRGITLQGLLKLLQKRPSLSALCIAIRSDSYADLPHEFDMGLLPSPGPLMIDLADSPIRPADIPELVDVFVKLRLPTIYSLSAWSGIYMGSIEGAARYRCAWDQVFDGVKRASEGSLGLSGGW